MGYGTRADGSSTPRASIGTPLLASLAVVGTDDPHAYLIRSMAGLAVVRKARPDAPTSCDLALITSGHNGRRRGASMSSDWGPMDLQPFASTLTLIIWLTRCALADAALGSAIRSAIHHVRPSCILRG